MRKLILLVIALNVANSTFAQQQTKIKLSGYLETYYGFDFNEPADNNRPAFVYSHKRHNEVNLNLGFIKGSFDDGTMRANLALMAGTYSNANLAAEPGVLKNIFEASAGLRISRTANLWVDAGIIPSHIGYESAISKDCWVLTRNIVSDNTPYYEAGVKITYGTADNKFTISGLYLNGWQRINRLNGNSQPAGGLQMTFKPTDKVTLNYSNYIGTEGPDDVRVRRFYNNVYGIFQLTEKLGLIAGIDYGAQQVSKGSKKTIEVLAPTAIAQYRINSKWALAGRVEYYEDKNGLIIATGTPEGFKTTGYSLNLDYSPMTNAVVRLEGKLFDSKDKIFIRELSPVRHNALLTSSIAISF